VFNTPAHKDTCPTYRFTLCFGHILKYYAHAHAPCLVTYANVRPVERNHSTSTAKLATGLLAVHTGISDAASGVIAADGGPIDTRTHGLNVLLLTLQGTPEITSQFPSCNPHNQQ